MCELLKWFHAKNMQGTHEVRHTNCYAFLTINET